MSLDIRRKFFKLDLFEFEISSSVSSSDFEIDFELGFQAQFLSSDFELVSLSLNFEFDF